MLLHSKLRSWLTVLGIVIGVAAVVSIISIGAGLQESVNSQLGGLGQDIVTVSSGSSRAFGEFGGGGGGVVTNVKQLSNRDVQELKLVPGIKAITGIVSGRVEVSYLTEKTTLSVEGLDPKVFQDFVTTSIESGRYLSPGDAKSIVIGNGVANNVFKKPLEVGQLIAINNTQFRIVGILQPATGFGGGDNQIYMSTQDARDMLQKTITLASDEYSSISIKVSDVNFVDQTAAKITTALMNSHHVRAETQDFSVTSPTALQERISSITSAITIFLGAIAAVSLIVGAVGVANTMFTSVLEKTKEIGIMKAIGAKNRDILTIFLFNSGMLGMVGGLIGIAFGSLISYLLPQIGLGLGGGAEGGGIQTAISINLLILALVFSIVIGMIAGAVPAYRASKLRPVDALRYE